MTLTQAALAEVIGKSRTVGVRGEDGVKSVVMESNEQIARAVIEFLGERHQPKPDNGKCGGCRDLGPHRNVPGCEYYEPEPVAPQPSASDLIDYARRWIKLHRENKYQREAARIMASVVDALEAAEAKIARVEEAVRRHPECDRYEAGDAISCGWKSAFADVRWALGGESRGD